MKLEIKNITKSFRKEEVLKDISYTFIDKMIYGIVGINGSGKSVLLKIITGLYKADKGEILFDNINYNNDKLFLDFIGACIEYPGFINDLSGLDNLMLLADIRKIITKEENLETLRIVGLFNDKDKKYGDYSLGMRQKLSIAQALMENPKVIILDEPFNGIDRESVKKIQEELIRRKENGTLIIITTHIHEDIDELCDKVLYLENGKLYDKRY